jgi:hypothetical protein
VLGFGDVLADANVSEKYTVSIFRTEDGDNVSPKRWHLPTSLHDAKTQKNIIVILTAVKTSNTTCKLCVLPNFLRFKLSF